MSETDNFFKSPQVEYNLEKDTINHKNIEDSEQQPYKDVKVIVAKIPSVSVLKDSIRFEYSDNDSNSDTDNKDLNQEIYMSLKNNNQSDTNKNDFNKIKNNMPNTEQNIKLKIKSQNISNNVLSYNDSKFFQTSSLQVKKSDKDIENSFETNIKLNNKKDGHELRNLVGALFDQNNFNNSQDKFCNIRNYSFSNDKLKAIDKENQRLLEKITLYTSESKISGQNFTKFGRQLLRPASTSTQGSRPSSATVNRRMQQRKIDEENMALLRRLQQVRPSKEIQSLHHSSSRPTSATSSRMMKSSSMTSLKFAKSSAKQKRKGSVNVDVDSEEPSTACSLVD